MLSTICRCTQEWSDIPSRSAVVCWASQRAFSCVSALAAARNAASLRLRSLGAWMLTGAIASDGSIFVYFRGSDVLVSGDLFTTTQFPVIDRAAGGSIDGFIEGLNAMLDIAVPKYLQEGGTYIIPGHGRICDEADLVEYRDMVQIVRDRIGDSVEKGMTLAQVQSSKPALDYDTRYDGAAWTSAMFVQAAYESIKEAGNE